MISARFKSMVIRQALPREANSTISVICRVQLHRGVTSSVSLLPQPVFIAERSTINLNGLLATNSQKLDRTRWQSPRWLSRSGFFESSSLVTSTNWFATSEQRMTQQPGEFPPFEVPFRDQSIPRVRLDINYQCHAGLCGPTSTAFHAG
jgi:hypothetical protein